MSLSRLTTPEGWPLPERQVEVAGRRLPVDLVVVAVVNALGTIALLVALWDALAEIPDMISGLFSSEAFVYGFSYLLLAVLVLLLFMALTPLATAYFLLRADPVGRDLQAFMLALIALTTFALQEIPGTYWLVLLAAVVCVAVLYLSPWARQALRESARARAVPGPVVLARFLSAALLAWASLIVVLSLPGLRFLSVLGVSFVIATLLYIAGLVLGWRGYAAVTRGPSTSGRAQLTAGVALLLVGSVTTTIANSQPFTSALPGLVFIVTIVACLWGPARVRAWFPSAATSRVAPPGPAGQPGTPPPTPASPPPPPASTF